MESKRKEIENWERNMGQKAINTRWVITEKVKERKTVWKARLVARRFEEVLKRLRQILPHVLQRF